MVRKKHTTEKAPIENMIFCRLVLDTRVPSGLTRNWRPSMAGQPPRKGHHLSLSACTICRKHGFYLFLRQNSRNGYTLGPVELIVWLEQGNQGDLREQDDQGEVYIIIFGMSKSSGFQKYSIWWVFQALCLCLCLCICVLLWFLNSFHHKFSEYVWL